MTGDPETRAAILRTFLAEHDEPCPACGYNLRGLRGEACPECGETLRLMVGMVEPRVGMYQTGLMGLAAGAWFCVSVLGYYTYTRLFSVFGGQAIELREVLPLVIGFVTCGGAMVGWLIWRAWIRHQSWPVRLLLAAGCWILTVMSAIVFFSLVR